MAWTTPRTWIAGELVTATLLNTHVRDNLDALKSPPTSLYLQATTADYTTSSTTFVDVDATNLALTITTTGGDVLIVFQGSVANGNATAYVAFDIAVDGTPQGGTNGLLNLRPGFAGGTFGVQFVVIYVKQGLSAGSHTFKLQWLTSADTATMHTNTAAAQSRMKPQSFVREF